MLLLSGCWQTGRKTPPALTEQAVEVAETTSRLVRIEVAMDEDLGALRDLIGRFFSIPEHTWVAPFPIDAFKHTAMSCLNAPYDEATPDPAVQEVATQMGIACAVQPLVVLQAKLGADQMIEGGMAGVALDSLRLVDGLRSGRASLQTRLRQLPGILRRTRAFSATRRLELRRHAQDLTARRGEYTRDGVRQALDELEHVEAQLDALDAQLLVLEEKEATWAREVGTLVEQLYKGISYLGPS